MHTCRTPFALTRLLRSFSPQGVYTLLYALKTTAARTQDNGAIIFGRLSDAFMALPVTGAKAAASVPAAMRFLRVIKSCVELADKETFFVDPDCYDESSALGTQTFTKPVSKISLAAFLCARCVSV